MCNKRPNIIVIMSDEHTWNITGCYNNEIVKTPNLDKLAANGVLLENCYTPSPLCAPARLAFTTGKYISRCGAWSNEFKLPDPECPSLPRIIEKAGYKSYLIGKMHYDKDRRYGFIDEHKQFNMSEKRCRVNRIDVEDEHFKKLNFLSKRFEDFHTGESGILRHDRLVTKYSTEFLANRKREDGPFLLLSGYLAPHFPITVPQKYYELYRDKVPMPLIPEGHIKTMPENYKVMRKAFGYKDVPEDIIKRGRELYYGFVTWFDNEVGKLFKAIEKSEAADNTIIIYTTDHGENLGEHGMWWKNNMYDTCTKIPCIISWPGRWDNGQRIDKVCSLLDVGKTIIDVCGGRTPEDWDGDSMVKLLDNEECKWKNLAVSEYYGHNVAVGHCMIRKDNYKYVYVNKINDKYGEEYQLFDLERDPGEFQNLAYEKEYTALRKELHELLVKEIRREPSKCEKEASQYINYAKIENKRDFN